MSIAIRAACRKPCLLASSRTIIVFAFSCHLPVLFSHELKEINFATAILLCMFNPESPFLTSSVAICVRPETSEVLLSAEFNHRSSVRSIQGVRPDDKGKRVRGEQPEDLIASESKHCAQRLLYQGGTGYQIN